MRVARLVNPRGRGVRPPRLPDPYSVLPWHPRMASRVRARLLSLPLAARARTRHSTTRHGQPRSVSLQPFKTSPRSRDRLAPGDPLTSSGAGCRMRSGFRLLNRGGLSHEMVRGGNALGGRSTGACQKERSVRFDSLAGPPIHVRVVGVHAGNPITSLTYDKRQIKVRLDGIDAPELRQPYGQASKKALSDMVFAKTVTAIEKKKDCLGRTVAHVLVDDRDTNLMMLEEGTAWHYTEYSSIKCLKLAEDESRVAPKGLWPDREPVPPWDWRRTLRERRVAK
jgi:endonuclease YncB( thermonuclease family)